MGVDLQGKLRVALGSVKDQASIGKAMIYHHDGFSDIEIAVVRATGHDHNPVSDKYMHEILFLVSNSPGSITFLAERLSHRLHKTRDRHVALKTFVLIHRLLRGGNRSFEQQLRGAHVSGHLQISTWWFPRNSNPSLSFLHKYAAYLEERMGWFINQAGKLEPIMSKELEFRCYEEKIIDMVFRRLPKCQEFLDKVLDCSPFDILPGDNLAQVAMSNTLKESFQVYMTFCEGVAALANQFFDLTRPMRALACNILKRASQQSQELYDLYENCKKIIGNKSLEYPSVEIIKMDRVLALKQFSSSEPAAGSTKSTGSSPSPPIFDCFAKLNRPQVTSTAKEGERDEQRSDDSLSSIIFSCTLETKISKVWVVFDEEEPKYESHVSVGKLFNGNRFSDNSAEERLGEIVRSREIKYSEPCSSSISPFTSCVGS